MVLSDVLFAFSNIILILYEYANIINKTRSASKNGEKEGMLSKKDDNRTTKYDFYSIIVSNIEAVEQI
jgi:hypothetical protein